MAEPNSLDYLITSNLVKEDNYYTMEYFHENKVFLIREQHDSSDDGNTHVINSITVPAELASELATFCMEVLKRYGA